MDALLSVALLCAASVAGQTRYEIARETGTWTFDAGWRDAAGQVHEATFALPADEVRADLDEPLRFQRQAAAEAQAAAVRAWAQRRDGPEIAVWVRDGGVQIQASGGSRERMEQALAEATRVGDQALVRYLDVHGFILIDGVVAPDHARHVRESAPALAPVVAALGGPGDDPRAFADLALSFVQSIPYEKASEQRDRYRRPLSVLGRDRGDCDSKSTLFLGLMRAAWPDVPLGIVYLPGHAFAALGIEPGKGDARLDEDGGAWLLAEPVGPRLMPAGEVDRKSRRRARSGRVTLRVVE